MKRKSYGNICCTRYGTSLIDLIIDNYFLVLENIGEEIEELENEIIYKPSKESIEHVHTLKRTLMELKKSV